MICRFLSFGTLSCTEPLHWWLKQWGAVGQSCTSAPALVVLLSPDLPSSSGNTSFPTIHFSDFIPPNASLSPGFSSMKCTIKQLHLDYGSNFPNTCVAQMCSSCVVSSVNATDLHSVLQCYWQGWDSLELLWNLGKLIQIMYNTLSWNTESSHLTFWHVYYVYANSVFSAEFPWR